MTFRKVFSFLTTMLVILLGIYIAGPRPEYAAVNWEEVQLSSAPNARAFAKTVARQEASSRAKPEARAEVVFAKADSSKTPTVFVYLHGFSASRDEGSPIVDELAQRYGANLYWTRLSDHGIVDPQSFKDASPSRWREEAYQMVSNARLLGNRVIVIGTSTGGTLALDLAANFPKLIDGILLYSPNIVLANPAARLLNDAWGLKIANAVSGGKTRTLTDIPQECDYIWTLTYRNEGVVALEELIESTMTAATFSKVQVPVMTAYYYKDEENKDHIVSTDAIREMMKQLGTPSEQKREHPLSEVQGHVITTDCRTTGLDTVRAVSNSFLEEVMGLSPSVPSTINPADSLTQQ